MYIARIVFFRPQGYLGEWRPRPGYHPQIDAGGIYTSCAIERLGDETEFEFEKEYIVQLRLLFPDLYREAFSVGSLITFYEGSRPVGSGAILEISSEARYSLAAICNNLRAAQRIMRRRPSPSVANSPRQQP